MMQKVLNLFSLSDGEEEVPPVIPETDVIKEHVDSTCTVAAQVLLTLFQLDMEEEIEWVNTGYFYEFLADELTGRMVDGCTWDWKSIVKDMDEVLSESAAGHYISGDRIRSIFEKHRY